MSTAMQRLVPNRLCVSYVDEVMVRYERTTTRYAVRVWGHEAANLLESSTGEVGHEAPWLADILAVAKISGRLRKVNVPPPDEILWFTIDANQKLINFDEDFNDPL
jgi:hypothetical protein